MTKSMNWFDSQGLHALDDLLVVLGVLDGLLGGNRTDLTRHVRVARQVALGDGRDGLLEDLRVGFLEQDRHLAEHLLDLFDALGGHPAALGDLAGHLNGAVVVHLEDGVFLSLLALAEQRRPLVVLLIIGGLALPLAFGLILSLGLGLLFLLLLVLLLLLGLGSFGLFLQGGEHLLGVRRFDAGVAHGFLEGGEVGHGLLSLALVLARLLVVIYFDDGHAILRPMLAVEYAAHRNLPSFDYKEFSLVRGPVDHANLFDFQVYQFTRCV